MTSTASGVSANSSLAITISLAAGGTETVNDASGSATYSIGATTLTLNETASTTYAGTIQDGSNGNTGGKLVVSGGGTLTLTGASTYTGGTTLEAGTLELAAATASWGTTATPGAVTFGGTAATLQLDAAAFGVGGTYAGAVSGFLAGDALDLRSQDGAKATLSGTTLTVGDATDGTETLNNFSGPQGSYKAASDGYGGTNVTFVGPAVISEAASPTGQDLNANKVVTFTIRTSEAVTATGSSLALSNSATAVFDATDSTSTSLVYKYTVAAADTNTSDLQATARNSTITDGAGNTLDTTTFTAIDTTDQVDTTAPTVSSPTDTVAQNAGSTPIGIAAPSDNLTPSNGLSIVAGSLPSDCTVTLADGKTPVTRGESLTAAQLKSLAFTPTPGAFSQGSTFTYTATDGAGNAATGTAALDIGGPGAPTITGTHASSTSLEEPVMPFTSVTLADPSQVTEMLKITLRNGGGRLAGAGLVANTNGSYTLAGSAATVMQQLDALSFTSSAPPPGTAATTTFVLNDMSSAGTTVTDAGTSVTDTAAAAPSPTPAPAPAPAPTPAPDAVSIDPDAAFIGRGRFIVTGTASSTAGVKSVEISAEVDGVETDLGNATPNPDGTFSFVDHVGPHVQGVITATETDEIGGTAQAVAPYSLQAGIGAGSSVAREDHYSADGSAITSSNLYQRGGSSTVEVEAGRQTVPSHPFDIVENHHQADTTFVFDPGYGIGVIKGFTIGGPNHDVLDLPSSDFTGIADVLRNTGDIQGSAWITDPKTGDAIRLAGVSKEELAHNPKDFAFHA